MPPDLHLHPDRLLAHAVTVAALAEDLRAVAPEPGAVPDVEAERLRAAVLGAIRELADLSAVLADAATAGQVADRRAAQALTRAEEQA